MNNLRRNKLIRRQLRELKGVIAGLEEYLDNAKKYHHKVNYGNLTYDSINSLTYHAMIKLALMRTTLKRDALGRTHFVSLADGSTCNFNGVSNADGDLDYIKLSNRELRKGGHGKCLKLVDIY